MLKKALKTKQSICLPNITEIMLKTALETKQSIRLPQCNRNNVENGIEDQTINISIAI